MARREVPQTQQQELDAIVDVENRLYAVLFEDRQWKVLTNGEKDAIEKIHDRVQERGNQKREALYG